MTPETILREITVRGITLIPLDVPIHVFRNLAVQEGEIGLDGKTFTIKRCVFCHQQHEHGWYFNALEYPHLAEKHSVRCAHCFPRSFTLILPDGRRLRCADGYRLGVPAILEKSERVEPASEWDFILDWVGGVA